MSWMSGQLPGHPGNTGTTVQVSAMSGHSRDILVTQAEPQNGFRVAPEVQQYTGIPISGIRPFVDSPSMVLSTTEEQKVTTLGTHRLKADLTIQELSPRTVPVRHQRYNKNSETRIQSKAVPTFHTLRIRWCTRLQSSSPCSISHA